MMSENLRQEMGEKARKNVLRFSAKKIVQQWDELFRSLVEL
jgi:glycosyltransferase involved in cell wall biosynthesis